MVSILGEHYYEFPKPIKLEKRLKDYLESVVDKYYWVTETLLNAFMQKGTGKYPRRERFLQNLNRPNKDIANAITTRPGERPTDNFVEVNDPKCRTKLRKLTELEIWRLMGIDDVDYHKAKHVISKAQLKKQAGNGIVVDVFASIVSTMQGEQK